MCPRSSGAHSGGPAETTGGACSEHWACDEAVRQAGAQGRHPWGPAGRQLARGPSAPRRGHWWVPGKWRPSMLPPECAGPQGSPLTPTPLPAGSGDSPGRSGPGRGQPLRPQCPCRPPPPGDPPVRLRATRCTWLRSQRVEKRGRSTADAGTTCSWNHGRQDVCFHTVTHAAPAPRRLGREARHIARAPARGRLERSVVSP